MEEMFKYLIKNVVSNVDMSSLRAPWQNGPYRLCYQKTERISQMVRPHLLLSEYLFRRPWNGVPRGYYDAVPTFSFHCKYLLWFWWSLLARKPFISCMPHTKHTHVHPLTKGLRWIYCSLLNPGFWCIQSEN